MSKRANHHHHLAEIGCIACDELGELGAGEREGWLADPSVVAALHPRAAAFAFARPGRRPLALVVFLGPSPPPPVKIRPSLSDDDGFISAIEWIGSDDDDSLALAIGTSGGSVLFYSLSAALIHKQFIYPGRVLRMRFRETRAEHPPAPGSEELCVVIPGVIARFDGSHVQSLLRGWFQEGGSRAWERRVQEDSGDGGSHARIQLQLWSVNKYGSCVDAAIVGLMPPPLLELQSSQRYYCAVIIGEDAVISAYRLSEDRSKSLVGAIISKVVPATFSTIASFSKILWRSSQAPTKKPRPAPQSFDKASPITCLKDNPRKGESLTLSPSWTLAAITDSLGRVLLLDTQALVVVRLWKGYRDACCLFVEMPISKDMTSLGYEDSSSAYCLCLAIHAPRKEIIEVWKMRTGPRLFTIPCPKGTRILQPSAGHKTPQSPPPHRYAPLELFLLDGDSGRLSVLNKSIA